MDFHAINVVGKMWAQEVPTLPVWAASDKRRFIYVTDENKYYFGGSAAWLGITSPATATTYSEGILRISTVSEATSGVLSDCIVTPEGLNANVLAHIASSAGDYAKLATDNAFSGDQNLQDNLLQRPEIKDYSETFTDLGNVGGAIDIDFEDGNNFKATAIDDITFSFIHPPPTGKVGSFTLLLVNGASHTINYPEAVTWPNSVTPVLGANSTSYVDILTFATVDAGSRYYGNLVMRKLPI